MVFQLFLVFLLFSVGRVRQETHHFCTKEFWITIVSEFTTGSFDFWIHLAVKITSKCCIQPHQVKENTIRESNKCNLMQVTQNSVL